MQRTGRQIGRTLAILAVSVAVVAGTVVALDCTRRPTTAVQAIAPPPVAIAEAEALGRRLEELLQECDAEGAQQLLDLDYTLDRVMARTRAPAALRAGLAEGLRRANLFSAACARFESGGRMDLLRAQIDGESRVVFRILSSEGLDYAAYYVGDTGRGEPRIYDVHNYGTGLRFSEGVAEMAQALLPNARISPAETARLTKVVAEARDAMRAGDNTRALRLLESLPARLQQTRPIMLIEAHLSASRGPAAHRRALDAYRRRYPGDPSLDLQLITLYVETGAYDQALAAVDRLDAALGGDPWLHVVRGNVEIARGDLDAAWRHAGDARRAAPEMIEVYWNLLELALTREDYPGALEIIRELESEFGIVLDVEAMREVDIYDGLLESDEWRAYREAHP